MSLPTGNTGETEKYYKYNVLRWINLDEWSTSIEVVMTKDAAAEAVYRRVTEEQYK
jgi:hypothetical protein